MGILTWSIAHAFRCSVILTLVFELSYGALGWASCSWMYKALARTKFDIVPVPTFGNCKPVTTADFQSVRTEKLSVFALFRSRLMKQVYSYFPKAYCLLSHSLILSWDKCSALLPLVMSSNALRGLNLCLLVYSEFH